MIDAREIETWLTGSAPLRIRVGLRDLEANARESADKNADKNAAVLAVQIRKTVKAQEALQTVIDACDADCSLTHIAWLAKQGLRP